MQPQLTNFYYLNILNAPKLGVEIFYIFYVAHLYLSNNSVLKSYPMATSGFEKTKMVVAIMLNMTRKKG